MLAKSIESTWVRISKHFVIKSDFNQIIDINFTLNFSLLQWFWLKCVQIILYRTVRFNQKSQISSKTRGNPSKMIKNLIKFDHFDGFSNFWSFKQHYNQVLIRERLKTKPVFNQKLVDFYQNSFEIDKNSTSTFNRNMILMLHIESDRIQTKKLLKSGSQSMTIRFICLKHFCCRISFPHVFWN